MLCLQTNTSMKLLSFTRSGIKFALSVKGDHTAAVDGITVTHTWRDTPNVRADAEGVSQQDTCRPAAPQLWGLYNGGSLSRHVLHPAFVLITHRAHP